MNDRVVVSVKIKTLYLLDEGKIHHCPQEELPLQTLDPISLLAHDHNKLDVYPPIGVHSRY